MTRDAILLDLYARLTSRKFWGFVLTLGFAFWNFQAGRLDAVQFQTAVTAAFTVYGVLEGARDVAAAWHPVLNPPETVVTTNVDVPSASPSPDMVRSTSRRVRSTRT